MIMQSPKKKKQARPSAQKSSFFSQIRLLPVLVLVAFLSLGIRVNDFVHDVQNLRLTTPVQAKEEDPVAEETSQAVVEEQDEMTEAETEDSAPVPAGVAPLPSALDGGIEFSQERLEVFSALAQRREALDQRERELIQREALLKAAERQFDTKLNELEVLRTQIQDLLNQQSEEEEARIQSLVKIYEGMKPKDAARIFNTLEIPVLLAVVGRMSERKSAPILAAMEAERARKLTILLAEQKQLPQLPE